MVVVVKVNRVQLQIRGLEVCVCACVCISRQNVCSRFNTNVYTLTCMPSSILYRICLSGEKTIGFQILLAFPISRRRRKRKIWYKLLYDCYVLQSAKIECFPDHLYNFVEILFYYSPCWEYIVTLRPLKHFRYDFYTWFKIFVDNNNSKKKKNSSSSVSITQT